MPDTTLALIKNRSSTNLFDPTHRLARAEIEELVSLATRAPTAFHLQNWKFIALCTPAAKERAWRQVRQDKIRSAAVTFIVCGQSPNPETLPGRLAPFVQSGHMSTRMADGWLTGARALYADPRTARDEAIRSASLAAATLMHAAGAMGFGSSPMLGFDEAALAREFGLAKDEFPVMLVVVGRSAPGNWPQKPRRDLAEVLELQ